MLNRDLKDRIEVTYDEVVKQRRAMMEALAEMRGAEETVKVEHAEEYAGAKTNGVRDVLVAGWLQEDDEYIDARRRYEEARSSFRLQLLEIDRLKLLVEAEYTEALRNQY